MNNGSEIIKVAVVTVLVMVLIGIGFSLMKKGQNINTKASSQMDEQLEGVEDYNMTQYDKMNIKGSEVIDVINKFFKDKDVEICISTKDGANFVYNSDGKGNVATQVCKDKLTDIPNYTATGTDFASATLTIASTALLNTNGYIREASLSSAGYINTIASFSGSCQRDANGVVRRITFVQQ